MAFRELPTDVAPPFMGNGSLTVYVRIMGMADASRATMALEQLSFK